MIILSVKQREETDTREKGIIPAVLYGPTKETASLSVDKKAFDAVYKEAGESSLITLKLDKQQDPVLIREVQRHPVSGEAIHVDFYQPRLDKKIEIMVPLVFKGEAPAVKELAGTLHHNIQELEISALPQNLPHEIVVNVEKLVTFEDKILVRDLQVSGEVEVFNDQEDLVAQVLPPENVEEQLKEAVEEKVEDIEKVGADKKDKEEGEDEKEKE